MPTTTTPRFRFFRAGSVDQVVVDEGVITQLGSLDERLWLALACPTRGLDLDARTLDLVDTDHDGRIRPPELIAAAKWATDVFDDVACLFEPLPGDELPIDALSTETETGRAIRDRAKRILANVGRADATKIRLADVLDTERIFLETKLNGDGVVPVEAADDPATRQAVADILTVMGSVRDRSGAPGIDRSKADAFFEQITKYASWLDEATDTVRVLGDATEPAAQAMTAVRAKVDDFFMRSQLAGYGGALGPLLDASVDAAAALAGRDLSPEDTEVARWPLAHVSAGASLPLVKGVNPAWAARMGAFRRLAVGSASPAEAPETLTFEAWGALQARLAPYLAWMAKKPDVPVATLGDARVRELASTDAKQRVTDLIAADLALEAENAELESVEKAIRIRKDLVPLLRNFINFSDFYGSRTAIFQAGRLYIDGRTCELCLPVHDVAKHAALAGLAKAYLLYCDCTRKGEEKRTIVAVVTAGSVDNLLVGRNGVFYDRKGGDWDATVTRIIENPISVRDAFLSPYKRFVRMVEEQVAKRAAAADDKAKKSLDEHAGAVANVDIEKPPVVAPPPEAKKIDIGTVAAIGVAVGGFATFCSSVFATFFGLGMWMPVGVVALLLAISGPSMIIAWLKLSQRNIGPILDANGWAVNAFARINVPFGATLTRTAELPRGAVRLLSDPFAEKKPRLGRAVFVVLLVVVAGLWLSGKLDGLLPPSAQSHTILFPPAR